MSKYRIINFFAGLGKQLKRIGFDILLFVLLLGFASFLYVPTVDIDTGKIVFAPRFTLSPIIDLIITKAILVSAGVVHGHITRKLVFPKVDWSDIRMTPDKIAVLLFYAMFIFAYARGG